MLGEELIEMVQIIRGTFILKFLSVLLLLLFFSQ